MAEAKQKFVTNRNDILNALTAYYKSSQQITNASALKAAIAETANLATAYKDSDDYAGLTNEEYAYLMNYEEILKMNPEALPLAPLSKRQKRNKDASTATAKPDVMAAVPRDAKTEWALGKLRDQIPAMRETANKESIVKIIKIHHPLSDRFVDKKNPTIKVDVEAKYKKLDVIAEDKAKLVDDEANKENYEKIVAICNEPDVSVVEVSKGKPSNAWGGLQIKHANGTTEIYDKDGITAYLQQGHLGINLDADKKKPSAVLKWMAPRATKDNKGTQDPKPFVTLKQMTDVRENPGNYYVFANDISNTQEEKSASSAISYKIYAMDKDGNIETTLKGTPKTRTRRLTGKITVFAETPSKTYWIKAFEKKGGSKGGASKNDATSKAIDAALLATAKYYVKADEEGTDSTVTAATSADIQARLKSLDFAAFNGSGDQLD